jgi:hypothetical protein
VVQGSRLVRASNLRAIFVFIAPPSIEELERRLRGRGTESEEEVATRIANARKEMERSVNAQSQSFFRLRGHREVELMLHFCWSGTWVLGFVLEEWGRLGDLSTGEERVSVLTPKMARGRSRQGWAALEYQVGTPNYITRIIEYLPRQASDAILHM